jgi:hypothetical protein
VRLPLLIALLFAVMAAGSTEIEPAVGVAASPAELVAKCSAIDAADAIGLQELEALCPGLEHALVELGAAPFVSEAQLDELSVHSLVDLQRLAQRYRQPPQAANDIAVDSLGPILESLQQKQRTERPETWFERLKKWLRTLLDRPQQESDSWLSRWLEDHSLPEKVRVGIVYGLIILVIGLAIAVVFNEARAAGLLKRGSQRRRHVSGSDLAAAARPITLADLESAELRDRPSLLLRLLVSTLVKAGRLRADKSLTHRELSQRAVFDLAEQRESFGRVAVLGERLLYGSEAVSADEIEAVVQAGRTLDAQLAMPKVAS